MVVARGPSIINKVSRNSQIIQETLLPVIDWNLLVFLTEPGAEPVGGLRELHTCQPSRFNQNCPDFLVSKPEKLGHSDFQEKKKTFSFGKIWKWVVKDWS